MRANKKRVTIWLTIGALVLLGLLIALWPRPLEVDLAEVATGPMMLTVDDEGETRIVDVFVVSAPIGGRLRRIEAEPGDSVAASQTIVAEIEPAESALLDPRTAAEAEAQLKAAESAESLARASLDKARAELDFAESELTRSRELAENGTISQRDLESAERAFETGRAALGVAHADMQIRAFELAQAKAYLMSPTEMGERRKDCDCVYVSAPVNGRVLQVHRESEGPVRAGDPLIEIGNLDRLEIVVDLLSIDAVKVRPGNRALIENWGGDESLEARVKRVEPFGFTKISALGIEEQRVNVVLDIASPREDWESLGHGYQVDVRVVLWESDSALKVPLTSLFREGDEWALFADDDGRARKRIVQVGHMTPREAEILSGVEPGERIVVYPGNGLVGGARIAAR